MYREYTHKYQIFYCCVGSPTVNEAVRQENPDTHEYGHYSN